MIPNDSLLPQQGILAIITFRPRSGKEQACLEALRKLNTVIRRKKYGRDLLLRDVHDGSWIGVRFWASDESRRAAQEDPEVFRLWQRLDELVIVERVRERLEKIDTDSIDQGLCSM